jgi:hypothetical protein
MSRRGDRLSWVADTLGNRHLIVAALYLASWTPRKTLAFDALI